MLFSLLSVAALLYGAYHEVTTSKSPIVPAALFMKRGPAIITAINGLLNLVGMISAYCEVTLAQQQSPQGSKQY
jgi:hypothetical protein